MRISNIWKAWLSTLIGVVIGVISSAAEMYIAGTFTWKTLFVGALPMLVAAITDILREVQEELNGDDEIPAPPSTPEAAEAPESL